MGCVEQGPSTGQKRAIGLVVIGAVVVGKLLVDGLHNRKFIPDGESMDSIVGSHMIALAVSFDKSENERAICQK